LEHKPVWLHPPDLALPDFLLAGELVNVRRFDAIAHLIFERRGKIMIFGSTLSVEGFYIAVRVIANCPLRYCNECIMRVE
jgi:hypothetical protein